MIVLWRPAGMSDEHHAYWTWCWRKAAEKQRETITQDTWDGSAVMRQWDRVNTTHGRCVIWARPEFIPSPALFDELDYLRREEQLVVTVSRYSAAFVAGYESPVQWVPKGVDGSLVVFQLSGQSEALLPPSHHQDIWEWLSEERPFVYHTPQRFSGDHGLGAWASRSVLGEIVYSPFSQPPPGAPWTHEKQLALWHERMKAWTIWSMTSSAVSGFTPDPH